MLILFGYKRYLLHSYSCFTSPIRIGKKSFSAAQDKKKEKKKVCFNGRQVKTLLGQDPHLNFPVRMIRQLTREPELNLEVLVGWG